MDPVIRVLLAGIDKNRNPRNVFAGMPKDVLKIIWRMVLQHYRQHIETGKIFFIERKNPIEIPKYVDTVDVNMLPFSLFDPEKTLPDYLKKWIPLIEICAKQYGIIRDKIAYLTVHQSFVKKGETQRRPGIHIDAPVIRAIDSSHKKYSTSNPAYYLNVHWGEGAYLGLDWGGIFIATDTENSCAVWNVGVNDLASLIQPTVKDYLSKDENSKRVKPSSLPFKEEGGGVNLDFLKPVLDKIAKDEAPKAVQKMHEDSEIERTKDYRWTVNKQKLSSIPHYTVLKPNTLYFMTDRTPHCALPVFDDCYRTFFRLVVGNVDVRWEDDCTPNDLVEIPKDVILKKSKFN